MILFLLVQIDDSFCPVSESLMHSRRISESRDTVLCPLNKYDHLENENTSRGYVRLSSPDDIDDEMDDTSFIGTVSQPTNPNILVPPDEHRGSANVTNMNVLVETQWTADGEGGEVLWTAEGEGGEVPVATGTVKEAPQTDKQEEERRKETSNDEPNYNKVDNDTYESLESKMPQDEFPTNELDPTSSDNDLSMSFYTYGFYPHSARANTSTTSGYISDPNAMWNGNAILLSTAQESKESEV